MIAYALLALFVVIQALDVWTTVAAIGKGAEEANLAPRFLMQRFGFWPAVIGIKAVGILVALMVTIAVSNAWIFTGGLNLIGVAVLVNNWRVLRSET